MWRRGRREELEAQLDMLRVAIGTGLDVVHTLRVMVIDDTETGNEAGTRTTTGATTGATTGVRKARKARKDRVEKKKEAFVKVSPGVEPKGSVVSVLFCSHSYQDSKLRILKFQLLDSTRAGAGETMNVDVGEGEWWPDEYIGQSVVNDIKLLRVEDRVAVNNTLMTYVKRKLESAAGKELGFRLASRCLGLLSQPKADRNPNPFARLEIGWSRDVAGQRVPIDLTLSYMDDDGGIDDFLAFVASGCPLLAGLKVLLTAQFRLVGAMGGGAGGQKSVLLVVSGTTVNWKYEFLDSLGLHPSSRAGNLDYSDCVAGGTHSRARNGRPVLPCSCSSFGPSRIIDAVTMVSSQKGGVTIIEDVFEILEVDPDGKKFDKVSRIMAHSELYDMDLVLDINVDLYPVQAGEKLGLCVASTLNLDGSEMPVGDPGQQVYDTSVGKRRTLADDYQYVMFGKVFKYKDAGGKKVQAEVYASFGGLLMQMSGDPKKLDELDVDQSVYLLIRKA